jgi:large subunit ribosomal protein L4
MAEAPVLGGAKRSVKLDDDAFGARFNGPLVHESVRAEFAARRRGSASTKTRGLVSGGGAKPWRQKGTGRARAGSSRSPVWTGGGTVFGPHPRSYTFKVNRKERRAALRSALSLHAERGTLAVLDAALFSEPSTRTAAKLLKDWAQPRATLVVVTANERDAALSFRNIDRVSVLEPNSVGVADIVGAASLLCSDAALKSLSDRAAGIAAEPEAPAAPSANVAAPAASASAPAKATATEPVTPKAATAKAAAPKATASKPAAAEATPKATTAKAAAPKATAAKPATAKAAAPKATAAKPATAKAAAPKATAAKPAEAKAATAKATAAKPATTKAAAAKPKPAAPKASKPKAPKDAA